MTKAEHASTPGGDTPGGDTPGGVVEVTWAVSDDEHVAFTRFSGDVNPMHTDPLVARRLPFGRVVVHGVHLLMRALDQWSAAHRTLIPTHIDATFRQPVAVGSHVSTHWSAQSSSTGENPFRLWVDVDGVRAVDIAVTVNRGSRVVMSSEWRPDSRHGRTRAVCSSPAVLSIDELSGRHGSVPVDVDLLTAVSTFPDLSEAVGPAAVAELTTLGTLIGMHVPGLHSMFSSLSVGITPHATTTEQLDYAVTRVDPRFSRAAIDVRSSALEGRVVAFVRPAPIDQAIDTGAVRDGEFAGDRWLLVGGSRGLGAAAVRLLAAGGADVRFTYHVGEAESAQLSAGTGARFGSFDVFGDPVSTAGALFTEGWWPTHLGWFASPPIFVGARDTYSHQLYERFVLAYVTAFEATVNTLMPHGLVAALWPSSEAVETAVPGLAEYADAKRLGEQRCRQLANDWPGLVVASPRLPRLLTDQSTTFVPTEFGDTASEVLMALRATTLQER